MKIGLFGFTMGHENMGCQALTCSFLEILSDCMNCDDLTVVNFGNEKTMGTVPSLFPDIKFESENVSLKKYPPKFLEKVNECNIVFDVTAGDGFSDIYFVKGTYRDVLIKIMCGKQKTTFVLAPQTYGPFKHKTLERLAAKAIRSADHVFARDAISAQYASEISRRDVKTVTDMAFVLPFKRQPMNGNKKRIGFNVSGLLWQGGFTGDNQFGLKCDYNLFCKEVIQRALLEDFEVHLIPHVTKSADPNRSIPDGDFPACEALAKEYSQVILAPCFENPYEAKNYISSMDYFIGARMHSTIASFSSGVVTIPFAYSRKFQGLYENLNYPHYVDGTKLDTSEAVEMVFNLIHDGDNLLKDSSRSMETVREQVQLFKNDLTNILSNVK